MTRQRTFFDDEHQEHLRSLHGEPEPIDPHVHPEDRPRLSRQSRAIYERLKRGPVDVAELRQMAAKYTGRISDLRDWLGSKDSIRCHRRPGGNNLYTLHEEL